MKKYSKGFTLMELLVVIAIIGILSSVVLASLNTARNKGTDAAIKGQLAAARPQAEIYYDGNGSSGYTSLCVVSTGTKPMWDAVKRNDTNASCAADSESWAMSAALKTAGGGNWCVDYTGASSAGTTSAATPFKCS